MELRLITSDRSPVHFQWYKTDKRKRQILTDKEKQDASADGPFFGLLLSSLSQAAEVQQQQQAECGVLWRRRRRH